MFGEVWAKWPLAKLVHPGWREAFRFFDTLGAALATLVRFFFGRLCFHSNSTSVGLQGGTPPDGYVEPIEYLELDVGKGWAC